MKKRRLFSGKRIGKWAAISMFCMGMGVIGIPNMAGISAVTTVQAATEYTSGNYKYTAEFGRATITEYIGNETDVRIPEKIDGYTVTAIGYNAFADSKMRTLYIPDTVTQKITGMFTGQQFLDCKNLVSVRWSSGLNEIPDNAFSGCEKLQKIENTDHVVKIDKSAFAYTESLKTISLPKLVDVEADAFYKSGLVKIALPSVKKIGISAFIGCENLTEVQLGAVVEEIGDYAFEGCRFLSRINLPESLKNLGNGVFSETALVTVTIPKNAESGGGSMGNTFNDCTKLRSVYWNAKKINLGAYDFAGCTSLTEIVITEGPWDIGCYAFQNCTSLKAIELPKSIKYIDDTAFDGCSRLEKIIGYYGTKAESFAKSKGIPFEGKNRTVNHKVTFDSKKGTAVQTQTVTSGQKAAAPANPKRKGYLFAGWYNGSRKYNFSDPVKANLTLTAKWSKVKVSKAAITKATNASGRKLSVTIKKVSKASGYVIQYSKNKNFSGAKNVTVTKTSWKSGKLAKGTYYVRVRAFRYDSMKKKVYGSYSAVKKVTIKK